jgi:ribosomal protein S14
MTALARPQPRRLLITPCDVCGRDDEVPFPAEIYLCRVCLRSQGRSALRVRHQVPVPALYLSLATAIVGIALCAATAAATWASLAFVPLMILLHVTCISLDRRFPQ